MKAAPAFLLVLVFCVTFLMVGCNGGDYDAKKVEDENKSIQKMNKENQKNLPAGVGEQP